MLKIEKTLKSICILSKNIDQEDYRWKESEMIWDNTIKGASDTLLLLKQFLTTYKTG